MSTQTETTAATILATLSRDHDRIDALLDDAVECVQDAELERAQSTFDEFDAALRRHIEVEEEILFPLFETRHGAGSGPVNVMTIEHRAIQRTVGAMRDALARGDERAFLDAKALLVGELVPHNLKEERFLYPAIDELLIPSERTALVHRLSRPA